MVIITYISLIVMITIIIIIGTNNIYIFINKLHIAIMDIFVTY